MFYHESIQAAARATVPLPQEQVDQEITFGARKQNSGNGFPDALVQHLLTVHNELQLKETVAVMEPGPGLEGKSWSLIKQGLGSVNLS